jgi:2-oxoglutarate/2-oxoacid ferredoxin oxidoreductase subunit beta
MDPKRTMETYLTEKAFPTVWCPGCGIGTILYSFLSAIQSSSLDPGMVRIVTGAGCAGKISEVVALKTFSVKNGLVIERALRVLKKDPLSMVVAFISNPDFLLTGARDFIRACKNQYRIVVIYINNFIYTSSRDNVRPITPFMRRSFDGNHELPFNIPHLANSCGASYIARWTPLRAGWLKYSLMDAFNRPGFSVVEVVSPCLIFEVNNGRIRDTVERMNFYNENTNMDEQDAWERLDLRVHGKIVIGKFKDKAGPMNKSNED